MGGTATCVLPVSEAGTYIVSDSWTTPNSNYSSSTATADTVTVAKGTPTTAITSYTTPITYGGETSETFTVTVTGPTGGATPTGTATVSDGSTLCTTGSLSVGTPSNVATANMLADKRHPTECGDLPELKLRCHLRHVRPR